MLEKHVHSGQYLKKKTSKQHKKNTSNHVKSNLEKKSMEATTIKSLQAL
jgi:hypothetical protein